MLAPRLKRRLGECNAEKQTSNQDGLQSTIKSLVQSHAPHLQLTEDGRVRCTLNGHTMPAREQEIAKFVNGQKYGRLKKLAEEKEGFRAYEPFIIGSKNHGDKLYCTLTCRLVNRSMSSIRSHMKGKFFLQAKEKFEKDEQELMEEPDLEDSEGEPPAVPGSAELLDGIEGMALDSQAADAAPQAAEPPAAGLASAEAQPVEREASGKRPKNKKKRQKAQQAVSGGEGQRAANGHGPGIEEGPMTNGEAPRTPPQQPAGERPSGPVQARNDNRPKKKQMATQSQRKKARQA